eukprot:TRINITY_DN13532_c0_g1_i1.p1 TRINITY_DN13532_c0_g1~~TRINITY_DN13532_c0_g1_i1.p1  ORF type:complete len:385 (+),score=117.71 TRINITY_DN13532_c0_g1_i1:71-1225(+)
MKKPLALLLLAAPLLGLGHGANLRLRRSEMATFRAQADDASEFQRKCQPYMAMLQKKRGAGDDSSKADVGMMKLLRGQEEDIFNEDASSSQAQEELWCIARKMAEERSRPGGAAAEQVAEASLNDDDGSAAAGGPTPWQGRKNVQWLHLHNYGGSFICQEAVRQGERTTGFNCNWENCSQQTGTFDCETKARSERYTFNMLERNLQPSDVCSDAISGTMLRDPLAGMQSTMIANHFDKAAILDILRTGNGAEAANHSLCLPAWDTYQHFDNFATRSISGAYLKAPGELTKDDLEAAKQRLRDMDVVMILEELGDHVPQLSTKFGWDTSHIQSKKKFNSWRPGITAKSRLEDGDKDFLRQVNALDYELYEFAKSLAREKTETARR